MLCCYWTERIVVLKTHLDLTSSQGQIILRNDFTLLFNASDTSLFHGNAVTVKIFVTMKYE